MARTPLKRQVCYNDRGWYSFIRMHNENMMNSAAHFARSLGGPPVNYGELWLEHQFHKICRRTLPALRERWYDCHDCGLPWRDDPGPMLQDVVWLRIAKKKELLCHPCTLRRLGRPIALHDLIVCEFNLTMWEHFA